MGGEEIADVMVEMAAFVGVRDEHVGSEVADCGGERAEGARQIEEQVLILKMGFVWAGEATEGTVGDQGKSAGCFAKTLGGIVGKRAKFVFECIVRWGAIGCEDDQRFAGALQEAGAGDGFVVRMSGEDEESTEAG